MSIEWIHTTVIIPATEVGIARELAAALTKAGSGMFQTPVYPIGSTEPSHYISSGMLDADFVALLVDAEAFYGAAQYGAAQQGIALTATLTDVQRAQAAMIVTHDNPHEFLAGLELTLQGPEFAEP